jgi:hypothetical protein
MNHETEITLGNMELCIQIEFSVTPYIPATYYDPPEGGEIEIDDVWVSKVSGATYDLDRHEIDDGWLKTLDKEAWDAVFRCNDIFYTLQDIAAYYEGHYHDF